MMNEMPVFLFEVAEAYREEHVVVDGVGLGTVALGGREKRTAAQACPALDEIHVKRHRPSACWTNGCRTYLNNGRVCDGSNFRMNRGRMHRLPGSGPSCAGSGAKLDREAAVQARTLLCLRLFAYQEDGCNAPLTAL